jgi:hypothetical protein
MAHKILPTLNKLGRLSQIVAIGLGLTVILMGLIVKIASAAPEEGDRQNYPLISIWQQPITSALTTTFQITPTSSYTYSVSLAQFGYDETTLTSPYDKAQYSLRFPNNWAIQGDGLFEFDLSYTFYQTDVISTSPPLFGNLLVKFDQQTLGTFAITEKEFTHLQLLIPVPASLLTQPDQIQHTLELILEAGFICKIPHQAKLVIYPTSAISINYGLRSPALDLSRYPNPFFQRTFAEPESVYFVLPTQPTSNDLNNALPIAAKLGELTNNKLVISGTTDLDLSRVLSSTTNFDQNLIMIGRPQNNLMLPVLNQLTNLPVSLHQQQLELMMQGPAIVAPSQIFTYNFTITNTLTRTLAISLVNPLPASVELIKCIPNCVENEPQVITWPINVFAPGEKVNFWLTLRTTDTLTSSVLEQTATLAEADLGIINAVSLTSTVAAADAANPAPKVIATRPGDYFFVYNGQPVATNDGILQEIISPWGANRVILIVTGLSDEAIHKASLALSSETGLPGMSGPVALAQAVLPTSEVDSQIEPPVERSFADLGYPDQLVEGTGALKEVNYYFPVPYGWRLTNDAAININFSHSQLLDSDNSWITVLLNGQPVTTVPLKEDTAKKGQIQIDLGDKEILGGEDIRLTLQVKSAMPGICVDPSQSWLVIKNDSKISLAHQKDTNLNLDFNYYPYPFHLNPSLSNLLFALPASPQVDEWQAALRLAAGLGSEVTGTSITPGVILGDMDSAKTLVNSHLIAIGRPSRNSVIQQVNSQLPQPFLPNSDEIEQKIDQVMFRLPPGIDLGYLELIPSPWDKAQAFLAVTGTTDKSIDMAVETLTKRPWDLGWGNLALIRDNQVKTIDTRQLTRSGVAMAVTTAVPEMASTVMVTPTITPTVTITSTITPTIVNPISTPFPSNSIEDTPEVSKPVWLIPLVVFTGVLVIAILVIAFWRAQRRSLKP